MAELGISIASKLIEVLGSEIIKEICDMWGYKSHLEDLHKTVSTIKNVLLDADSMRELSNLQQGYIQELKDVVYDADDLFDEFFTLAELKLIDGNKGGKFSYKIRRFFSSKKNEVGQAYKMARKVKKIKEQLGAIVDNHKNFGFCIDYKPIRRRREETCSYVDAKDVIGRDKDKEAIIGMLLNPNVNEGACFVTIVGVGGSGKTTLAQLVYNDEKIREKLPDHLRLWVCVSDQDGEQFDVKAVLCKILELVCTGSKFDGTSSTMELVQNQFRNQLGGKKYFLVLDDVWNEDREKWLDLKIFLMLGEGESRILVTTRSERTSTIIGDQHAYMLQGLTEEDSWQLFEITAFTKRHEPEDDHELVEIGKKIVENCCGIPLAIKVVGSLLFGQNVSKWRSIEESGLANIGNGDNKIMSILKLSYHNLEPSLKSCFSYCALFAKDFVLEKERLIGLWMAQGYIVPLDGGQSIEDAAEEHFLILLRRCFFQDVMKDEYANVKSVKIHDLMHDVAQEVGKDEICVVTSIMKNFGDKIRHVHFVGDRCLEGSLCRSKIRSLIYGNTENHLVVTHLDDWKCLRVLDLSSSSIRSLPDSVGKLLLLRQLNLSFCGSLEVLSDSITKLHNLQTLVLRSCTRLREMPNDFSGLVKLRHLDLLNCYYLSFMPQNMDKLINLRVLPFFVVGKRAPTEKQCDDELKVLKVLTKIKGDLCIEIGQNHRSVEGLNDKEEGYLKSLKHLTKVIIGFDFKGSCVNPEATLEYLEPHPNIKGLELLHYKGATIPSWGRTQDNWAVSLPHLVTINLHGCTNLEQLPVLSELPYLKSLELEGMENLEYMEDACRSHEIEATLFFPSLESLEIINMRRLKGWWNGEALVAAGADDDLLRRRLRFQFPRLSKLTIEGCNNLTCFPPCPSLEDLELQENNKKLQIIVFESCASSLRTLRLFSSGNLRTVSGLEHLTTLEELTLDDNEQLSICEDDDEPWKSFHQSLHSLTFRSLPNMTSLPKGMQHFTSLQRLSIESCYKLEGLPEWISCLSSLQSLYIGLCPVLISLPEAMRNLTSLKSIEIEECHELEEKCKKPNGEHWPKIQHIPHRNIGWWSLENLGLFPAFMSL